MEAQLARLLTNAIAQRTLRYEHGAEIAAAAQDFSLPRAAVRLRDALCRALRGRRVTPRGLDAQTQQFILSAVLSSYQTRLQDAMWCGLLSYFFSVVFFFSCFSPYLHP